MRLSAFWLSFSICFAVVAGRADHRFDIRLNKRLSGNFIPIGYRSLRPKFVKSVFDNGGQIVWDPALGGSDVQQLGPGIYITPGFGQWRQPDPDAYDCAVLADKDQWAGIQKLAVPAMTTEECPKSLFWSSTARNNRVDYVNAHSAADISRTVLISEIWPLPEGYPATTQYLIPPNLLTSGALTLFSQCAKLGTPEHDALGQASGTFGYNPVSWFKWDNVQAESQDLVAALALNGVWFNAKPT